MLEVEGLSSHYGRIQALRDVDIKIRPGEIVTLVGGNGAGKTTLLKCLSGVQPVSAGKITFEGKDITRTPAHRRVAAGISQTPEGRQVFTTLSVADNLRLGGYLRSDAQARESREEVYDMFPDLRIKRTSPAGQLSGGQQQMLAIGRALMARPRLLLLDEPSMGLSPILVEQIMNAIKALQARGVTIFLVEQNAYAALSIADRGYVLETGSCAMTGTAAELLADDKVREAYLGV